MTRRLGFNFPRHKDVILSSCSFLVDFAHSDTGNDNKLNEFASHVQEVGNGGTGIQISTSNEHVLPNPSQEEIIALNDAPPRDNVNDDDNYPDLVD